MIQPLLIIKDTSHQSLHNTKYETSQWVDSWTDPSNRWIRQDSSNTPKENSCLLCIRHRHTKNLLNIIFLVAHLNPYKGLERFHERAFREEERFIIQSRPINLLQSLFSLQIFPTGSKSIQVPDVASTAAAAISNLQLRNLGIGQSGKAWQELF